MSAVKRWAKILFHLSRGGDENDPLILSYEEILRTVREIQEEAAANAIRNVPPLAQLRVGDERASDISRLCDRASEGPWKVKNEVVSSRKNSILVLAAEERMDDYSADLKFIASSRHDIKDLLYDRETLLRLLHDSEGIDAYQRGYEAGLAAREQTV